MLSLKNNVWVYGLSVLFIILNVFFIAAFDNFYLTILPFAALIVLAALFNLDKLWLLVVFCTPLSFNLEYLGVDFGLYLPTEPLLFGILVVFIFNQIYKPTVKRELLFHPISIAIIFYLGWIFMTSLTSVRPLVSIKFFIAKLWLIIPVFYFGVLVMKNKKNMYRYMWAYAVPLIAVVLYTLVRHGARGFSEEAGHWVMSPFFKDHTSYGAVLAMFFPMFLSMSFYKKETPVNRLIWQVFTFILFIGIIFSYTRAAWLSLVLAAGVYACIKLKIKFKWLLTAFVGFILALAPFYTSIKQDMERNKQDSSDNFSDHVTSASNISTDASNLERINRWNCAIRMFQDKPVFGFGPGTYMFEYAPYQHSSELTIISTNMGTGGNAHSEYLGPLAETGFIGMFSVLFLVGMIFYKSMTLYIKLEDPELKRIVMFLTLGLLTYFVHGILNNYLDTDKASIPVWGFLAIIVSIDLYHKKKENSIEFP